MSVEEQAEALYARVRSCRLCPLARTRTHAVPGEGSIGSEVMFIGEAPGVNEDRQGRPFVGAAGQFLDQLLAQAGVTRADSPSSGCLAHQRDAARRGKQRGASRT